MMISSPADGGLSRGALFLRRRDARMNAWDIVIPVVTLIVGFVAGFAGGVFYLRSQIARMQKDPEALAKMAKQMGYNLNRQQLQKAQQMLKNQNAPKKRSRR
jgi:hypothetical protein